MSLYRAFIEVHIDAENLGDAYNRIAILMLNWPGRRWKYAKLSADDWAQIATSEPHFPPEKDLRP